jgi:sigma-54 dependent transcriptional regulator, acetoin dehydrogenase operon transcriptional activator AcoR
MPAPPPLSTRSLPGGLFFQTPEQRARLARQRFFEEDQRPTGLVNEGVLQSWGRCRSLGHQPARHVALDPISGRACQAVLQRNRDLLLAASEELAQLSASLAGTGCRVLLTNAAGVVVHSTPGDGQDTHPVLDVAARVGVNLAEERIGTTAPGIVVRTGVASTVMAYEHFYEQFQGLHCAAAPIFDVNHRLAGVLDVSIESRPFGFDAGSVVGLFATSIENRLLQAQSHEHVVLQFQTSPALLGTPLQAMAGVDGEGRVVWINGVGRRLLGRPQPGAACAQELFGHALSTLLDQGQRDLPSALRLPNGLGIWMRATLQRRDGVDMRHGVVQAARVSMAEPAKPAEPVPEQPPASLADAHRQLIDATLQRNGGNVARTARELGVSRGLLYRHMQKSPRNEPRA